MLTETKIEEMKALYIPPYTGRKWIEKETVTTLPAPDVLERNIRRIYVQLKEKRKEWSRMIPVETEYWIMQDEVSRLTDCLEIAIETWEEKHQQLYRQQLAQDQRYRDRCYRDAPRGYYPDDETGQLMLFENTTTN